MPKNRKELILSLLANGEKINIDDLAEQLHVSSMTIRRDLSSLEDEGEIIRTHGGAVLNKPLINELSFHTKEGKNTQQKKEIAVKALEFISDNSTIILDSGTTTLEIARLLKVKKNITVITNDIKIAAEFMESDIKVVVIGGELQNNVGVLFGPLAEQTLKSIHVDICFLGTHAVHLDSGITSTTFEKAYIKNLMISAAKKAWLVADSSKFDEIAFTKVCNLSDVYGVITDKGLDNDYCVALKDYMQVVIAE